MVSEDWRSGFAEAIEFAAKVECPFCATGTPWRWSDYAGHFEHDARPVPRVCLANRVRVAARNRELNTSTGDAAGREG